MIFIDILLTSTSLFGLYTKFSQTLNVSVLSTLQPQLQMSDFLQYAFHAEADFGLAKISGAILDLQSIRKRTERPLFNYIGGNIRLGRHAADGNIGEGCKPSFSFLL